MAAHPDAEAALAALERLVAAQLRAVQRVEADRPLPADALALLRTAVPGTAGLAAHLDADGLVRLAQVTGALGTLRAELERRHGAIGDRLAALRRARRVPAPPQHLDIPA